MLVKDAKTNNLSQAVYLSCLNSYRGALEGVALANLTLALYSAEVPHSKPLFLQTSVQNLQKFQSQEFTNLLLSFLLFTNSIHSSTTPKSLEISQDRFGKLYENWWWWFGPSVLLSSIYLTMLNVYSSFSCCCCFFSVIYLSFLQSNKP